MMRSSNFFKHDERGAALVEFAIGAAIFLTAIFAVLEFGRLLWMHNALTDATRRAAHYAMTQGNNNDAQLAIKNVVVYGDPAGTGTPLASNLSIDNVIVSYSGYALSSGTVTVEIQNYDYNFVVPLFGATIQMPAYRTTLTGESAGFIPDDI
ncbi:hypothetical protein BH18ACI2_BH18ACI2_26790 [soil metagenome]